MFLRLSGKTQKGKNRIRELGPLWKVREHRDGVPCIGGGRGIAIEPLSDPSKWRWISEGNDPDFDIEE